MSKYNNSVIKAAKAIGELAAKYHDYWGPGNSQFGGFVEGVTAIINSKTNLPDLLKAAKEMSTAIHMRLNDRATEGDLITARVKLIDAISKAEGKE